MTAGQDHPERPRRAVLVRHQQVGIGDVSRTGCRFEASEPLAVGAVGMLTVEIEGRRHVELFRVCRSRAIPGGSRLYETGVEFLPMPAEAASLHDIAAQLEQNNHS
jgi:hypothetical protein